MRLTRILTPRLTGRNGVKPRWDETCERIEELGYAGVADALDRAHSTMRGEQ